MLRLSGCDFSRTWTLGPTTYFEGDLLTVFKGGIAVHFDFRVVNKEIFATIFGGDESVAFFRHRTILHFLYTIYLCFLFNSQNPPFADICYLYVSYRLTAVAKNLI